MQQDERAQIDCEPAPWFVGIYQLLQRIEDVVP